MNGRPLPGEFGHDDEQEGQDHFCRKAEDPERSVDTSDMLIGNCEGP